MPLFSLQNGYAFAAKVTKNAEYGRIWLFSGEFFYGFGVNLRLFNMKEEMTFNRPTVKRVCLLLYVTILLRNSTKTFKICKKNLKVENILEVQLFWDYLRLTKPSPNNHWVCQKSKIFKLFAFFLGQLEVFQQQITEYRLEKANWISTAIIDPCFNIVTLETFQLLQKLQNLLKIGVFLFRLIGIILKCFWNEMLLNSLQKRRFCTASAFVFVRFETFNSWHFPKIEKKSMKNYKTFYWEFLSFYVTFRHFYTWST